jgi:hypothetical protein
MALISELVTEKKLKQKEDIHTGLRSKAPDTSSAVTDLALIWPGSWDTVVLLHRGADGGFRRVAVVLVGAAG